MIESFAFLVFNLAIWWVIYWGWKQDNLLEQSQDSKSDQ